MSDSPGPINSTVGSVVTTVIGEIRTAAGTAEIAIWIAAISAVVIAWSVWMQRPRHRSDNASHYGWSVVRIAAVAALFAELTAQVHLRGWLTSFDVSVWRWCTDHRSPAVTAIAVTLTDLASPIGATVITAGLAAILYRRTRTAGAPILLIGIVAFTAVINSLIKVALARPRPPITARLVTESTYSFASGHVAATTALVGAVLVTFGAGRGLRWRMIGVLAGAAVVAAIAATRLYLGVHWLTDTAGGALLATVVILTGALIGESVRRHRTRRAEHDPPGHVAGHNPSVAVSSLSQPK